MSGNLTIRNRAGIHVAALYLCLRAFGGSDESLSIAEVVAITGLNKGTVRRILSTHTCFVRVERGVYRRR